MATQKYNDDLISQLADELGISKSKLASMDIEKIRELMDSGDLDPSQKAKLVRAKLKQMSDAAELVSDYLEGSTKSAEEDVEPMTDRKGKGY